MKKEKKFLNMTSSEVDSIMDEVLRPKSLIGLSRKDPHYIANHIRFFVDYPLNTPEARQGLARCIAKLNESKRMPGTFSSICLLLARLGLQEVNFRVNLVKSSPSSPVYVLFSENISVSCLKNPESEVISTPADNLSMEVLEIYFVLKRNGFKDILSYIKKPNQALKENEWLVRAVFDCCRSSFETALVSEALVAENVRIPPGIYTFLKSAKKRKLRN